MQSLCINVSTGLHLHTSLTNCQVADVKACQRLSSTSSSPLIVSRTRLSTAGDWAFPVAAARVWNSLPQHVTSSPSVAVFQSILRLICSYLVSHLLVCTLYTARAVTFVGLDTIITRVSLLALFNDSGLQTFSTK